jgi:hypothetical protein
MPKPIPASSPKELHFEMDCLCGFRKTIVILLTVEVEGYYNGFYSQSRGYIRKVIYSGGCHG